MLRSVTTYALPTAELTCAPAATLLAVGFHQLSAAPAAPVVHICEDCGATGDNYLGIVENWNGVSWQKRMGCCSAARNELGLKPRAKR